MISPRSYQPAGNILKSDYQTMLAAHPEAFDCIVWPALPSSHDEILSAREPEIPLLDRDERAQAYGPPVIGRAMIAPSQTLDFEADDSGASESFNLATEAFNLLLSVEGLRLYSLVEWRESVNIAGGRIASRTVYIARIEPMGKTLDAGNVYVCYPLPALGEKPEPPREPDPCPENPPQVGLL